MQNSQTDKRFTSLLYCYHSPTDTLQFQQQQQQSVNPFSPTLFWLWEKWVYQSVQRHTGLTHPFNFWIKKGVLDQYGPEHFEV